ncbi:MAG: tRNA (adenosine(37)-N6)-threonylcarbamoyltransferase complex dimerization subunit type 1 TsaB [Alphaproteobacteria bacterium]|nr:tRNA (adenosine(37)-N6)-threonylcarbamoyltransferase complex dimerization subunit type 1 TsaB [Alphaproteobacteria bacterium]
MLLLSLDTASTTLSLSLFEGEDLIASFDEVMLRGQAERLIPEIQSLFEKTGKNMKELSAVAVGVGPGSFTGVRIALSAARGLGLALGIPVYGVSSLEAYAYESQEDVLVTLDTKRGDFYVAGYNSSLEEVFEPRVMTMEEIKILNPKLIASDVPDIFKEAGFQVRENSFSLSQQIAKIAKMRGGNNLPAEPLYLREADVTISTK